MIARIISALVIIPLVLGMVIYAGRIPFLLALGLVGTLCLYEYLQLAKKMGLHPLSWFSYAAFWILLVVFNGNWIPQAAVVAAVIIGGLLAALYRRMELRENVQGLMGSMLGLFYIFFSLYPALPLRFDFGNRQGLHWFLILLVVLWVGDTGALVVGKSLGHTPFAAAISPKKTNEGALGGLLAGIGAAVLLQQFLFIELPLFHVILISIAVGVFGQLGDLAESLLKRAAGVKDSSHLIPGHGGVLDRIDSLMFALPVLYIYLLRLYAA